MLYMNTCCLQKIKEVNVALQVESCKVYGSSVFLGCSWHRLWHSGKASFPAEHSFTLE